MKIPSDSSVVCSWKRAHIPEPPFSCIRPLRLLCHNAQRTQFILAKGNYVWSSSGKAESSDSLFHSSFLVPTVFNGVCGGSKALARSISPPPFVLPEIICLLCAFEVCKLMLAVSFQSVHSRGINILFSPVASKISLSEIPFRNHAS